MLNFFIIFSSFFILAFNYSKINIFKMNVFLISMQCVFKFGYKYLPEVNTTIEFLKSNVL